MQPCIAAGIPYIFLINLKGTGLDVVNLLIAIFSALLTVAVFTVAYRETREVLYNRRRDDFSLLGKILAKDSPNIRLQLREYDVNGNADYCVSYLIHARDWNHIKGTRLMKIESLLLVADDSPQDYKSILQFIARSKYLPLGNRTIVDNLRIIEDSKIYDLPSYAVSAIHVEEKGIKIGVKKGYYFDWVNTCFGYGYEAAYQLMLQRTGNNKKKELKMRIKFPITDLKNRFALIGILTLVVIKNIKMPGKNEENIFLIHKRGQNVAESRGLINAVPGGTFQPSHYCSSLPLVEALEVEGVKHTIIREFGEEVFSIEEFSELSRPEQLQGSVFWAMLNDNIYYLGCGINPINAYLEVLTCAVIDMQDQASKKYFGNRTLNAFERKLSPNFEGEIFVKPFNREALEYYEKMYLAAPALKQICKIILEDYDSITDQIGVSKK